MGDSSYYNLQKQPPQYLLQEHRLGRGDPNGPCYPTILLVIFIISLKAFITMLIIFVVKITLNLSYFLNSGRL